ncbi:major capsid protein P2, partial [Vibrio splendidus]|uniref:major capsid protein P2 n=1 Tax=Vibrio splendidus TaxID=29497 RepID=UPI001F53919B
MCLFVPTTRQPLSSPNGPTYHELVLETNASAADMQRIAITLNAEEIYVLTGE